MDINKRRLDFNKLVEGYIRSQKWQKLVKILSESRRKTMKKIKIGSIDDTQRNMESTEQNNLPRSISSISEHSFDLINVSQLSIDDSSEEELEAPVVMLNLAILFDAPLGVIQSFLQYHPPITTEKDVQGLTPLHVICATRGTSFSIIQALVRHDLGRSACIQDSTGRTPMHQLMNYICYPKPNNLDFLQKHGRLNLRDTNSRCSEVREEESSSDCNDREASLTQEDFRSFTHSLNLLARFAITALFQVDSEGDTPIDVLHNCKYRYAGKSKCPKWERADITNILIRDILVQYYRQQKSKAESAMDVSKCDDITEVASVFSNSTKSTVSTSFSKLEVKSLGYDGMDLSTTQY